jgi:hypothetical protein
MSFFDSEDINVIIGIDPETFAINISGIGWKDITASFFNHPTTQSIGDSEVVSFAPVIECNSDDVEGLVVGNKIRRLSTEVNYEVTNILTTGHGSTTVEVKIDN